jgi:hypothetical protein
MGHIPYFTDSGPESGPILWRDACSPIPVTPGRDDHAAVGKAKCVGWLDGGAALWRVRIGGDDLPGLWVVIDREFRPA